MTTSESVNPHPDSPSEEVARLQAEIARLKESQHKPDRRGWWRPLVAGLLVLLAAVLAPLSVLATWASGQIQDTDRYLETVAPLASDPAVQDAISVRIEQIIFSYLDLEAVTEELVVALDAQGLPESASTTLRTLAGPLATGVQSFVGDRIDALVRSDAFEQAWVEANRTAHQELVAALTGETGGAVEVDRGAVSVNLAVLINTVKQQLSEAGFELAARIPEVSASFTIIQSADLAKVQTLLGVLDDLSTWLPVLGLGLLAAAVLIARDRRRMVLVAGLAVAGAMLLLGATLNAIRPFYLDALPASSSAAAAGAVYDQLVSFIRVALRGLLVVALTVAIVAWFSARSGPGASARGSLVRGIGAVRRGTARAGLQTGGLGVALATYRGPIRVGVVGAAAVLYLAQDHPTGGTALTFVVITALLLVLVEVLAAEPQPAAGGTAGHAV